MANGIRLEQFPHPWRGIGIIVIFLAAAPPLQLLVAAFASYHFAGGRRILFEIGAALQERFWPHLAGSYSFYMPAVFFAAVWCAYQAAMGKELSLGGAIGRMVVCGLACEALYDAFALMAGQGFRADLLLLGLAQWTVSAFFCRLIARKLGLCCAQGG